MTTDTPTPESWGDARSKTVVWHDPMALAKAGSQLSGRDFLQAIADGELAPPPIAELMGFRVDSVADGEVTFSCRPDESVYNPLGIVHGGMKLVSRGWVTKPGRRVSFAEGDVRDPAGKLLATASSALMILSE